MGATETIARWVVNTGYEDIPPDAIRVANESCFDLLGVILAGSVQPVGQIIQKYVADQRAAPEATVLSGGGQSTLANAALANGTMGHALDYDDFGGFGHPTVAIFPALLAIGEHSGATGRDLLEAYVIGCEVGLALQHATKYKQMDKGFHATAVIGRLACAAACAKLMRLDEAQTITALGIAGSMASGLIHNFGTMTKPLHAGLTGRDGITAAQLAQAGLTAGDQVVEHPFGFAATVLGTGIYDLGRNGRQPGPPLPHARRPDYQKIPLLRRQPRHAGQPVQPDARPQFHRRRRRQRRNRSILLLGGNALPGTRRRPERQVQRQIQRRRGPWWTAP